MSIIFNNFGRPVLFTNKQAEIGRYLSKIPPALVWLYNVKEVRGLTKLWYLFRYPSLKID